MLPKETLKSVKVCSFKKETVEHMDVFALRHDNVLRAAFSDRTCERFLLKMNRNRLWLKYSEECVKIMIKAMCKAVTNLCFDNYILVDSLYFKPVVQTRVKGFNKFQKKYQYLVKFGCHGTHTHTRKVNVNVLLVPVPGTLPYPGYCIHTTHHT